MEKGPAASLALACTAGRNTQENIAEILYQFINSPASLRHDATSRT